MNTPDAHATATVFQSSKPRTLLHALGAFLFVQFGVKLFETGEASAMVVGLLAVCFFLTYLAVTMLHLVRRSPELTITAAGITHHSRGSLEWAEIERIRFQQIGWQGFLEVLLHDPDAYLNRGPLLKRALGQANRGFGLSPVTISAHTVPASLQDLAEAMRRHHPNLVIES
ncbi:STM3941 family protein [Nocardia sp. CDC160]|uniref:STM3941 family protein n=1 Tax=Nocardia sp. CDC160 TaxID=3112166 RepID=UPI002DB86B63|nr:STM3941 family protein [Nocardia sp. CDC160]MEC3915709.1 STM3941 family protein [Nocardia sp. CDC160]